MSAYVILRCDWDRSSVIEAWRPTLEAAERYLIECPPTKSDRGVQIGHLTDGGGYEDVSWHEYEPERYYGPTVRARVQFMNRPGYFHRVPIDCVRPHPDAELTVDCAWRVVETSCCATEPLHHQDLSTEVTTWRFGDLVPGCHCGAWQLIEGSPEAIAEMVEAYGVPT